MNILQETEVGLKEGDQWPDLVINYLHLHFLDFIFWFIVCDLQVEN